MLPLLLLATQLALAAPPDPIVGGVGLIPIRLSELEEEARFEHVDLSKPLTDRQKRGIICRVAQRKILARRARRLGYLNDPAMERLLVGQMKADEPPRAEPTEAELQEWYDAHITDYTDHVQVSAWRIVVRVGVSHTNEEALGIITAASNEIKTNPERFMLIANRVAEQASGTGATLDRYDEKRGVQPRPDWFVAARAAPVGELSTVLRTSEGYELFVVTARSGADPTEFKAAKAQVRRDLIRDRALRLGVEEPPERHFFLWWWHAPMKTFGAGRV